MNRVFSRAEVKDRLRGVVTAGAPIVASQPCNGIVAKCTALGGADLIIYTTMATPRSMGFPTRVIEDFHGDRSLKMHETYWQVVHDTPLIAGLDANDIESLDHGRLVDRFIEAGAAGIANMPTAQMFGDPYRTRATKTRHGFDQELALIATAHAKGLFTVGYVYYADDARAMLDAGADMIIATCGHSQGGTNGYPEQSYDHALGRIAPVVSAVREASSDAFCLAHGGPFVSPEASAHLYDAVPVNGIYLGSGLDRIPIERGVREVIEAYKAPDRTALHAPHVTA